MAELIVQSVGPGVFPGESLESMVSVGSAAALAILGQGATKIYPSRDGKFATSLTELKVHDGGELWWLPGELIPFRDARYTARVRVELEQGARLALWEIITPGRLAMGEAHVYGRLDLRLRLEVAGRVALIERAVLDPVEHHIDTLGSQGRFPYAGSLVLFGYSLSADIGCCSADVWLGMDSRDGLTVVRGLARATVPLRDAFLSILRNST
jgi:urease accessory protein